MRIGVASDKAFSIACALACATAFGMALPQPAEANNKPAGAAVGGAAPAVAAARPSPQAQPSSEQNVASADGRTKPTDPLSNLNVSARTKELQERADRILAENGETRSDEGDVDSEFAAEPAPKPLQPSKAKELAAGIRCIAGCD